MSMPPSQPTPTFEGQPLSAKLQEGYALVSAGRASDAMELGRRLAEAFPANAHVLVFASEGFLASGDPQSALSLLDRALEASGGDIALKLKKASLLQQMRRRREAVALANEVASQATGNGRASWQVGHVINNCNRPAQAVPHYERARQSLGEQLPLLYELAVAQFFSGAFEDAERNLDRLLEIDPTAGHALYLRSTVRRQTEARNHVDKLEQRIALGFPAPALEASARYALSKELEDLGHHAPAFEALLAAAAKKRSTLRPDVAGEIASLEAVCDAYSREVLSAPAEGGEGEGGEGEGALFILGMPRTGTTLVERLLVRSGQVDSAGELLDFGNLLGLETQRLLARDPAQAPALASLGIDFAALGREYMRGARDGAGDKLMFIDKMPVNFMYCGAIHKALPRARIIHLVRDPLDSCYAVFKTLFFSAYHFSYDQRELGDYYVAYHRMMRHWHDAMPGAILDVRYESLVTDPVGESKRILAWCGLEWSEAVLDTASLDASFSTASAAQVREPVHSRSINSSRRHLAGLAPLAERLAAAGLYSAT